MSYSIQSLSSRRIVAGAIVDDTVFYVADADGKLVGKKAHGTAEEAQSELDGLGFYLQGLAFAKAQFPKDGDKAHVAKANVVARFLQWGADGQPVITADSAETEQSTESGEAGEPTSEEETF